MNQVVVVSPHLDDAVLSAWLVLQSRPRVRVVSCFAGVPPTRTSRGHWDVTTGASPGRSAVEIRRAEDLSALALSGSEPVHLDLLDAQYRSGQGGTNHVVDDLTRVLRPHLAEASEVWLPAGLGNHIDHVAARRASLAATAPGQRRYVYADLPYAGQPAWPIDITGNPRDMAVHFASTILGVATPASMWQSVLSDIPGVTQEWAEVHQLTPGQARSKWRAVSHYRSQLAALRCGRRNALRRRRVFAYEAYWLVNPDPQRPS